MEKQCPCCKDVKLRKAIRRGVEIDYCPDCNGIWLDNGELNKIVTESVQDSATENSPAEISAGKSVFKSFLNLMGSTKDDADDGLDDNSGDASNNDSDSDFISESDASARS